jgi:hypothetical protein
MSSKQSKKPNKKKAPVTNKNKAPAKKAPAKKAPAKKAPAKKAPAPKSAVGVRPEDADRLLAKATEPKPQFVSAEKLMKTIAEQTAVVRVNDLKSASLRKRMLAWFKLSK